VSAPPIARPRRKRLPRFPRPKPGEIVIAWMHRENDVGVAWADGCRAAARYLLGAFTDQRCRLPMENVGRRALEAVVYDPSTLDEMKARGFDVTTLRVSICLTPERLAQVEREMTARAAAPATEGVDRGA
jgi:hypothetical protein